MECPEGKLNPDTSTSRSTSGRGRWMANFIAWFSSTTRPRFSTLHQPGRLAGVKAAATPSTTSNVTGVASAEKLSMTGVSHGWRSCPPNSHHAAASSFMFSLSSTFSSSITSTMAHTDVTTSVRFSFT